MKEQKLIDYGIPWGEKDLTMPYGEFEDRFRHLYVLGKTRSGKEQKEQTTKPTEQADIS